MGAGEAPRKAPSQQDVASRAGVSRTTVSLVMNDAVDAGIPAATRARVWQAAKDLNFMPNALARSLRAQRSGVLGLLTNDIATTPFAVEIIKGAQDAARERGKTLLILDCESDEVAAHEAVTTMAGWQAEGLIFATDNHREFRPPANLEGLPAVLVDCFDPSGSTPSVVPDERTGGRTATDRLLEAGHRRIGLINGPSGFPASAGRLEGYRLALEHAGLDFEPELLCEGDWWQESGYEHAMQLLKLPDPPTALFCANDWMAMGAYDALARLDLSVPHDVSVVGFDDRKEIAAHMRPPLTTVALPYQEMGRWGVERLLNELDDRETEPLTASTLPCPLIERHSVAEVRAASAS